MHRFDSATTVGTTRAEQFSRIAAAAMLAFMTWTTPVAGQMLEEELKGIPAAELTALAKSDGDAARGAVVFHQQHMACAKCHTVGAANQNGLGPDLTALGKATTDESLVESVLTPSKVIRKGFESATMTTVDGKSSSVLLVERTESHFVVRDVNRGGETAKIAVKDVEEFTVNALSIMPAGQVNQLNSRQQFLDLIRYLMEIRDGGAARAQQLQPSAALLTYKAPEYEQRLDHAALIADWNDDAKKRGEAVYQRVCANCHGTKDKPGSLPTSLRFAEGKFKNGSDPLSMYRTLTYGFGLMAPQTWMVPSQKYDVIHYIRETYLKPHNPTQFTAVDQAFLAKLPAGDTRGPEPSKIVPWSAMDYGPSLTHTYEIPGVNHNLAYKGTAVRLDPGAGGVSRGRHWMIFDSDTLRTAAAWQGSGQQDDNFIDWQGIQFNGAHGVHPKVVGRTAFVNSTGPGWANPIDGSFLDDQRVLGRDGKRYGPLPRAWGKFHGLYHHGQQVVFRYSVGTTEVLEAPSLHNGEPPHSRPLLLRTFNIGPRDRDLLLQAAEHPSRDARIEVVGEADKAVVRFAPLNLAAVAETGGRIAFDGSTYLEIANAKAFDLTTQDFTIAARLKTKTNGTIWSLSPSGSKWAPNGQTFFLRDGRLAFDVGWVGAVAGRSKINDGVWRHVAVTWEAGQRRLRLFVNGKLDGEGTLAAKAALPDGSARIGFTSPNFPRPESFFQGDISEVRFYQRRLTEGLQAFEKPASDDASLAARWVIGEAKGNQVGDATGKGHEAQVRRGTEPAASPSGPIVAGFAPRNVGVEWTADAGRLRLRIPAGKEPLRFSIWMPAVNAVPDADAVAIAAELVDPSIPFAARDLNLWTQGGPARWPQIIETQEVVGTDEGPFATDVLTPPESNPWLAQTRFSGLDFLPDGRIAVCSWDGDVWLVAPDSNPTSAEQPKPQSLRWRRIATGMFQPLGLKFVEGKIHVSCRDQLTVLHDLNGDEEIDFYECLNNDHQVTEHFHEFAMGLQTDAEGNFYYAKSGCHGKAAVVPHHGTLLKVGKDGSRTEILATGFRAANGVCLNPDGSFVVTDQEGFWNPKNRINWVTVGESGKPNFYGNMLGYHDVVDSSDSAMTPPLCWITNAFDRSPAELLWVDGDRWGPLKGSLLSLSYGNGKVFLVPHENVRGAMQGGMIALPLPSFPTGVMRGRFHPANGQLYLCGMFAWAGDATQPGGLYRLRKTEQPVHLPVGLKALKTGLKLTFTAPLDPSSIDVNRLQIKTWSLKRTAGYGSKHFDEKPLSVRQATISPDRRTLTLEVAEMHPTWCMEILFSLRSADGVPIQGVIHNTIHALGE